MATVGNVGSKRDFEGDLTDTSLTSLVRSAGNIESSEGAALGVHGNEISVSGAVQNLNSSA